jgi:hypothetical protein
MGHLLSGAPSVRSPCVLCELRVSLLEIRRSPRQRPPRRRGVPSLSAPELRDDAGVPRRLSFVSRPAARGRAATPSSAARPQGRGSLQKQQDPGHDQPGSLVSVVDGGLPGRILGADDARAHLVRPKCPGQVVHGGGTTHESRVCSTILGAIWRAPLRMAGVASRGHLPRRFPSAAGVGPEFPAHPPIFSTWSPRAPCRARAAGSAGYSRAARSRARTSRSCGSRRRWACTAAPGSPS